MFNLPDLLYIQGVYYWGDNLTATLAYKRKPRQGDHSLSKIPCHFPGELVSEERSEGI